MASPDGPIALLVGGVGVLLLGLVSLTLGAAGSTLVLGGTLLGIAAIGLLVTRHPAEPRAG